MFRCTIIPMICLSATLLIGCGSSNNQQQKGQPTQVSSESTSSSSASNSELMVQFVFPTFQANLGSVTESHIKLVASLANEKKITAIEVEGISLSKNSEGYWVSESEKLSLVNSDSQTFEIYAQDEDGNSYQSELVINNSLTGIAGSGDSLFANSLVFRDSAHLFVSDAYEGALISVDIGSAVRTKIQQYAKPEDSFIPLSWPIKVDVFNEQVYVLADYYTYNEELGREAYSIDLNVSNYSGEVKSTIPLISNSEINRLSSVNSFILDVNSELPSHTPALEGASSIYALDFEANTVLKRVLLETGRTLSVSVQQGADSQINADHKLKSILNYSVSDSLLVLRSQSGSIGLDTPSIVEISFQREDLDLDGISESTTVISQQFAVLESGSTIIRKPTAMTLSHNQTTLYIAAQDTIWAMDLTQESKPFELLTSSSITFGKKGQGPRLGSSITSMTMHPIHDVLYVAAGAQGIIAIDVATGDRITVAK